MAIFSAIGPVGQIFGVVGPFPLKGFPEGRARIRIRNDEFVNVFIKTKNGIRHFIPREVDGYWVCDPRLEQGRNARLNTYEDSNPNALADILLSLDKPKSP